MRTPAEVVASAREAFDDGRTKPLEFREQQLKNLIRMYEENTEAMLKALHADLRKPKLEGFVSEVAFLLSDTKEQLYGMRAWAKPEKVARGMANVMDDALIYKDPYGVVLVIGAWNYPLQLTLAPLAGAIAAGNCVVVKPSEVTSSYSFHFAYTSTKPTT